MNVEYLKNISNVNLEMLPPIMEQEYNKIKFKFDTKIDGTYFSRMVFDDLYAETKLYISKKRIDKISDFNNNILKSIEEYDEGFWDAYYEENLLVGITKEEDQVFEIFSRIYKKNTINS